MTYPKGKTTQFRNLKKVMKSPYVLYANFVSVFKKDEDEVDTSTGIKEKPKKKCVKQKKYETHEAVSWYTRLSTIEEVFAR